MTALFCSTSVLSILLHLCDPIKDFFVCYVILIFFFQMLSPFDGFGNLTDVMFRDSAQFSQFIQVLYTSQLIQTIRDEGPFTMFAPSNYAFSRLPDALLQDVIRDTKIAQGETVYVAFDHWPVFQLTIKFYPSIWLLIFIVLPFSLLIFQRRFSESGSNHFRKHNII